MHGARKRLGPERVQQLVTDYVAGDSTRTLVARYQLGKGAVLRFLDEHGVTRRPNRMTDAEIQEATRLYQQGLSLARVGERFGRDPSMIHLVLRRAGVVMRDSQGRER